MTDWPHSPIHRLDEAGTFMVTAGTYEKAHLLRQPERLRLFQDKLFVLAIEFGWMLQAWSIFSNHYHIVGMSSNPSSLPTLIRRLHGATSHEINRLTEFMAARYGFNTGIQSLRTRVRTSLA